MANGQDREGREHRERDRDRDVRLAREQLETEREHERQKRIEEIRARRSDPRVECDVEVDLGGDRPAPSTRHAAHLPHVEHYGPEGAPGGHGRRTTSTQRMRALVTTGLSPDSAAVTILLEDIGAMNARFGKFETSLDELRSEMKEFRGEVVELKESIGEAPDEAIDHEGKGLKKQIALLVRKAGGSSSLKQGSVAGGAGLAAVAIFELVQHLVGK